MNRKIESERSDCAKPVSALETDHHATKIARLSRTPILSTTRPENR
jgi:hypothetical protein